MKEFISNIFLILGAIFVVIVLIFALVVVIGGNRRETPRQISKEEYRFDKRA